MQIELTPEQHSFIALGIEEGRFRDSQDAIKQALAQWERRERARAEFLSSLDSAEQSIDLDEGEEYPPESLNDLVASVRQRGQSRLPDR